MGPRDTSIELATRSNRSIAGYFGAGQRVAQAPALSKRDHIRWEPEPGDAGPGPLARSKAPTLPGQTPAVPGDAGTKHPTQDAKTSAPVSDVPSRP